MKLTLSDREKLFPERPEFAAWRVSLDVRAVIEECTTFDTRIGKLRALNVGTYAKKLEHLYEFLSSQGKLTAFDEAWEALEREAKRSNG